MKRIGIIGSGDIGSGIARLAIAAGYEVLIANSRGPASLQGLIDELGPQARSGDVREAAEFGEIPVLAIPLGAYPALPEGVLAGKAILSTGNYYLGRDGRIPQLDALELTTAELEQLLPGSVVVKAFNNIFSHHIPALAAPVPRTALAIFGDDEKAKAGISTIVDELDFEPLDAGTLAESWRTEPESGAYTPIYAADLAITELGITSPHWVRAPVTGDQLRQLVARSQRADVAALEF